jgi:hypothetical protein
LNSPLATNLKIAKTLGLENPADAAPPLPTRSNEFIA